MRLDPLGGLRPPRAPRFPLAAVLALAAGLLAPSAARGSS